MTTLHERTSADNQPEKPSMLRTRGEKSIEGMTIPARDRREHRRHDLEQQGIPVDRWDNKRRVGKSFGQIVDISAGGVRIRTTEQPQVQADGQMRIRLELPDYAGISPFIDNSGPQLEPRREWVGWLAIARVSKLDEGQAEIAGRLVDMDEIDRGMLGLYLSTQPLAA
jgi:hypothetical protein